GGAVGAGERGGGGCVGGGFVGRKNRRSRGGAVQFERFQLEPVQPKAEVAILAVKQRAAVFQVQQVAGLGGQIGRVFENTVVENLAILIDFHESRSRMGGGAFQGRGQGFAGDVDGAGDKRRLGGAWKCERADRRLQCAVATGPRHGSNAGGRGELAFAEAGNLVVEQQDLDPNVAPQGVHQVRQAGAAAVAVASHDPDGE